MIPYLDEIKQGSASEVDRIKARLKELYGTDLSGLKVRRSDTPTLVDGRENTDMDLEGYAGNHTDKGYVNVATDDQLAKALAYYKLKANPADFRKHMIAHELAHEIYRNMDDATRKAYAAKLKDFRTPYTDTVGDADIDKERFTEYAAGEVSPRFLRGLNKKASSLDYDPRWATSPDKKLELDANTLKALLTAQKELPKGYKFKILDGLRTLDEQKQLVDQMEIELKKSNPDNWEELLNEYTGGRAELDFTPEQISHMNHRSGRAVDLTLMLNGKEADMGLSPAGNAALSDNDKLDTFIRKDINKRRQLLKKVLLKYNFENYPGEWWHWGHKPEEIKSAAELPAKGVSKMVRTHTFGGKDKKLYDVYKLWDLASKDVEEVPVADIKHVLKRKMWGKREEGKKNWFRPVDVMKAKKGPHWDRIQKADISLHPEARKAQIMKAWALIEKGMSKDEAWKIVDAEKQASITLDIEKGDTLLGGRFKNIKTVVKDIGTDELGQPTINGKKLLSFRIAKKMPDMEKNSIFNEIGEVVKSLENRTGLQLARLAGASGLGLVGGAATGIANPGDPEHRAFSAQIQGLGAGVGAGAGGMTGYHLTDRLAKGLEAAGHHPSKSSAGNAVARLVLPFILGSIGAGAGGMGGHAIARARYNANEGWRHETGQETYEEKRSRQLKQTLITAAALLGSVGLGYGGYKAYEHFKE